MNFRTLSRTANSPGVSSPAIASASCVASGKVRADVHCGNALVRPKISVIAAEYRVAEAAR